MTANEPSTVRWPSSDPESSDSRIDTKSLEIGMTGMSLVSGLNQESGPNRKETGSTISSTPPEEDHNNSNNSINNNSNHGTRTFNNNNNNNNNMMMRSSMEPPPSPSNNSDKNNSSHHAGGSSGVGGGRLGRPPGMNMPSPIGKPGHNKTSSNVTSTTSPLLSLTPNSSVDGNSEWTMRQASPTGDAPAMPFLTTEHRRLSENSAGAGDTGSVGSYRQQQQQQQDADNDGLLGLGALRERTHSSGSGNFSSSSPVARGYLPSHDGERRRDRPPLSQSYNDGASSHGGGSVGDRSVGSAPGLQFQQSGFESGDPRGFGAIGRAELRSSGSADSFSLPHAQNGVFADQQHGTHLSQKFGSLPSLGSHIQQQRGGAYVPQQQQHQKQEHHDPSKPRHGRSLSQGNGLPPATVQLDPRTYGNQQQYSQSTGNIPQYRGNNNVAGHHVLSSSYGDHYATQKRNSLPNFASTTPQGYGQMHPSLERRDALDFHQQQGSHHSSVPITEDMRFMGNPMVSPGHSPHQAYYGGHSRQGSDASAILSSSPISMGNTMVRNHGVPMTITRQSSLGVHGDEDLQHPLIGENIEVPADHYADGQFLMNAHGGNSAVPLIRANGHGHSMSMGELPYGEPGTHAHAHHLPTAGTALPLPKVVFNVKFKRTQRNFVLGPRISRDLKIGTYVKVEADRGEDLGIVIGKVPADKFNFERRNQYTAGMGPPGGMGGSTAADLKRVIRLATHDEVSLLGVKREEEEELLKICRGKVRQRGLPMNVVDAEYQFDRHKLTFFFEAEGRVDFRELVRDLFSIYKTRIWMQQLDKSTATSAQAIISPQANLQMDYGTPIIAPASEFADSIPLNGGWDYRE